MVGSKRKFLMLNTYSTALIISRRNSLQFIASQKSSSLIITYDTVCCWWIRGRREEVPTENLKCAGKGGAKEVVLLRGALLSKPAVPHSGMGENGGLGGGGERISYICWGSSILLCQFLGLVSKPDSPLNPPTPPPSPSNCENIVTPTVEIKRPAPGSTTAAPFSHEITARGKKCLQERASSL